MINMYDKIVKLSPVSSPVLHPRCGIFGKDSPRLSLEYTFWDLLPKYISEREIIIPSFEVTI